MLPFVLLFSGLNWTPTAQATSPTPEIIRLVSGHDTVDPQFVRRVTESYVRQAGREWKALLRNEGLGVNEESDDLLDVGKTVDDKWEPIDDDELRELRERHFRRVLHAQIRTVYANDRMQKLSTRVTKELEAGLGKLE